MRSNLPEGDPATLRNYYLQLGQVEKAFRNLAYCLHVTIGFRLKGLAPGLTPRSPFEKFAAVQMIDALIPTTDGREPQLTRYTQPEPELTLLLNDACRTSDHRAPASPTGATWRIVQGIASRSRCVRQSGTGT